MKIKKTTLNLAITILIFIAFVNRVSAANYYWVGGSGNWSSFSGHWATSSGGSVYYSTPPSGADVVIFDNNSGLTSSSKTITMNIAAVCGNITISGVANAPIFNGTSTLSVYGSMVLQSGTTISAPVSFLPSGNQTLTTNGVALSGNVNLGGAGKLSLVGNTVFNNLNVISGTFDTQNYQLNVTTFTSSSTSVKTIVLGSSSVYISNYVQFAGSNLTMQAGTSSLHFTKSNMNVASNSTDGLSSAMNITLNDVYFDAITGIGGINFINATSSSITGRNLIFKSDGYIASGSHNFQNIAIGTSKTLTLPGSETLTVGNSLTIGTSSDVCTSFSVLQSGIPGTAAKIILGAGAYANVYHTLISDINISPNGVIPQAKSYDNGGNSGWAFPAITGGINYYWTGNSGNWSVLGNWKIDDGFGNRIAASCLPSITDDVFFDNSSFSANGQIVNLDAPSICHNISFIGTNFNPTLSGAFRLRVSGSAVWKNGMTLSAVVDYSTRGNQTITSNGVIHGGDVFMSGSDMTNDILTLVDAFSSNGTVSHFGGTFATNGFGLTVSSFYSNLNNARLLNFSTTTILVTGTVFNVLGSNLTLTGAQANIRFVNPTANVTMNNNGYQFNNLSFEGSGTPVLDGGRYNIVTFTSNGLIDGARPINVNVLNFLGTSYSFTGTVQTHNVYQAFNASGTNCNNMITISSPGTYFIRFGSTASINVNWAVIKGSRASRAGGTLAINATNSIDNGSNIGWVFDTSLTTTRNLYWVGGSGNWSDMAHWSLTSGGVGGECVPRATDDVFFNANSGFTSVSKTVTGAGSSHNFTVSGTTNAPVFTNGTMTVSGSMELQTGTTYGYNTIFAVGGGNTETLTTNGNVIGGNLNVFGNASGSLKLMDNLVTTSSLTLSLGILETNNKNITAANIGDAGNNNSTTTVRTFKLGSSKITITGSNQVFTLTLLGTAIDSGTSEITFTANNAQVVFQNGMIVNKLIFNNTGAILNGYNNSGDGTGDYNSVTFNEIVFKGAASIYTLNNKFGTLLLSAGYTYGFKSGGKQYITGRMYASGNSCRTLVIKALTSGSAAQLDIAAGTTSYNYVVATDINATNKNIYLDVNSTDGGGNTNLLFDTSGVKGTILGLGPDKLCFIITPSVPSSTILTAEGFYGDLFTTYSWTKLSGSPAAPGILGTGVNLDISATGYGTYRVSVDYGNCPVTDDIVILEGALPPVAAVNQIVCFLGSSVTTVGTLSVSGTAVKWYKDAALTIPVLSTATLANGSYYATQTNSNNCESLPARVNVVIDNCNMANPTLRQRTDNQ